jgi:DNA-binding MarR family transcriptional regulator
MLTPIDANRIAELASCRRRMMDLEQIFFKSRTHTSLEILVFLAQNGFNTKLSTLYDATQATDASVRQHLRALEKLNLVRQVSDDGDRRARTVSLTDYGRDHVSNYARQLAQLWDEMAQSVKSI